MYTLYARAQREVFITYTIVSVFGSMLIADARYVYGWARYFWATTGSGEVSPRDPNSH